MGFDQGTYWADRGNRYVAEFAAHSPDTAAAFAQQEHELRPILAALGDVRSVLEIGCGFGRSAALLLGVLPGIERYVALDVSPGQVQATADRFAHDDRVTVMNADFRTARLDGPFDLVFACEVFLHFPPNEIDAALTKAQSLGARLLHVDPYERRPVGLKERASTKLARWRGELPRHQTDWVHDYSHLPCSTFLELHPLLDGKQHAFLTRANLSAQP